MPPAIPPLVFLSGLKGMLSGPITQEAGITQDESKRRRRRGEEEEEEEGGSGGAGTRRQLRGRRKELCVRLEIKMHGEKVESN